MKLPLPLLIGVCFSLAGGLQGRDFENGAVATVHPLATDAAITALRRGGNAIDAAVAAGLTLGVVDGHNSGIGGGCFILIRAADGTITCLDGRETAGAAAQRDMYVVDGKVREEASKTGALAAAVPGALAAYDAALKKHGKLKLKDLLLPAADLAERGFEIDEVFARKLAGEAKNVIKFPASAAVLLKIGGEPLHKGDHLVQKDLAQTYRAIAKDGIGWFYRGAFAQATAAWMKTNGGILTEQDFANYVAKEREPLRFRYRGYELVAMPPPSSGGLHVAQVLQMIERFAIKDLPEYQRVHVMGEAMKLAFADRAYWLGDPDFAKAPRGLMDREYTDGLADRIQFSKATPVPTHGIPAQAHDDVFGKHTTHISTADAEGNWVAMTQTINTAFGSKVIVPGTGVILNNEMDDFSIQPGVPNAFRLVGAEANAIIPGKRPLSSMSPTLVMKEGKPFATLGAAGGPTIITQVTLTLSHLIDLGMPPADALAAPRFHHQWAPDLLRVETKLSFDTLSHLETLGHELERMPSFGACQCIITIDGKLTPASDPRVPGKADGW